MEPTTWDKRLIRELKDLLATRNASDRLIDPNLFNTYSSEELERPQLWLNEIIEKYKMNKALVNDDIKISHFSDHPKEGGHQKAPLRHFHTTDSDPESADNQRNSLRVNSRPNSRKKNSMQSVGNIEKYGTDDLDSISEFNSSFEQLSTVSAAREKEEYLKHLKKLRYAIKIELK